MAVRAQCDLALFDTAGNIKPTSTVRIYEAGTSTPISQNLYAADTGGSALTQPISADVLGRVVVYAANGQECSVSIDGATSIRAKFIPDASSIVTTHTTQTITGIKTFELLRFAGAKVFDVEAPVYGGITLGTDNTATIQACVDAVKAYIVSNPSTGAVIRFTSPYYYVSTIKVHSTSNILFEGLGGPTGIIVYGNQQTNGTHGSTGRPVFDCAGSDSLVFRSITVYGLGAYQSSAIPTIKPNSAWLFAATGTWGVGSFTSATKNTMVDCGSVGHFQGAAVAMPFSTDSVSVGCGFQQWQKDAPCLYLYGGSPASGSGPITVTTGHADGLSVNYGAAGGDHNFLACEFHHMPASGGYSAPYGTSNGYAAYISTCAAIRFIGGNMASEGTGIMHLGTSGTAATTGSVIVKGGQWYTDNGTYPCQYGVVIGASCTAAGLDLDGINLSSIPASGGAMILLNNQSVLTASGVRLTTIRDFTANTRYMVLNSTYSGGAIDAITQSDIDCAGMLVDISQGTGPRFGAGTVLKNFDTLTKDAGADYSVRWGTGYLALCAGQTTQPATTGVLRFQKRATMYARNEGDTADLKIFGLDASNILSIGESGSNKVDQYFLDSVSGGALAVGATNALKVTSVRDVQVGQGALATNATDGFFMIPGSAGAPTGAPTIPTGMVALHYDATNFKIYAKVSGGSWKSTAALT